MSTPAPVTSTHFSVLPNENASEFAALLEALRDEFAPQTGHENFLVEMMAQARWRIQRVNLFERKAFDELLENPANGGGLLTVLQRYAAAAERSYYKAHRELVQNRRAELKSDSAAMDHYIKTVIYAPMPTASSTQAPSAVAAAPAAAPVKPLAQSLGNLALRL